VEEGSAKLTGEPGSSQVSDYVRLERRDGVAIVTLDHPADRNALSLNMTRALTEVVQA
jgi:enoyl-CoA hydratase/carnithine racemase